MHKKIFEKFHNLNDSDWIDLLFQSVDSQVIHGISFPGFPEENIQASIIGSSGKDSLHEPKYMYQEIRRISALQNKNYDEKTTLLDFACGYGRMIRFFMKDIYPGNLYGSDVTSEFINICRNTFNTDGGGVTFDVNNPFPPIKYDEKYFDIIMAYSLFSHLSEDAHLAWLKEFLRVLKPNGLLFLTIRQQTFLSDLRDISIGDEKISDYNKILIEKLGSDTIQKRFNRGEYIYHPSGGGYEMTNDFYGDTVIPDKYIHRNWTKYFDVVEHYDAPQRLRQAFICLRPKK